MFSTRPLEFERIVAEVAELALTPIGLARLEGMEPSANPAEVSAEQQATSETVRFFEQNPEFPLRAGPGLADALAGLGIEGRPLDPLQLRTLAEFVDSVERSRGGITGATGHYPILVTTVSRLASFAREIAAVREAIDVSGDVLDNASPALRSIRDSMRRLRQRLRQTLEHFARGKDTAKYLQDEVITERNGRFVLLVRAEHRGNVPGIVHGSSASGASLFLEPAATVEINNDIVELEEREREEIFRILLELTDRFRARPGDLRVVEEVGSRLDVLQARARFSARVGGIEPVFVADGSFELRGARHPLLGREDQPVVSPVDSRLPDPGSRRDRTVVPIDVVLEPPSRVLLITGPNTGGKTVALKTAGLFVLMAQSGLHVPAAVARIPVFRSVFADIGDEQSIAASLSTFSAHITNLVAMERSLALPALVLLDEVGTGTDPNEGGALATALVNHFKQRGAHLIATTHFDAVKTWGAATEGVTVAGFAFDPQTYAPTYRLVYGAPGRSLAIEIAQRLGLPLSVVSAARGFLSDDQKRVQARLDRIDAQARALDADRSRLERDQRAFNAQRADLDGREKALTAREDAFKKRLNERLDERLRQARRDIDAVIDELREKSNAMAEKASLRAAGALVSTGESGAARAEARAAVERIAEEVRGGGPLVEGNPSEAGNPEGLPLREVEVGARVVVGALGLEGIVSAIHGSQVEVDVRGKRMRAKIGDLRVIGSRAGGGAPSSRAGGGNPPSQSRGGNPSSQSRGGNPSSQARGGHPPSHTRGGNPSGLPEPSRVHVNVDLRPREGLLSEINVIGCTVDEAVDRVSRFLDDTLVTDLREVRIVHGHGTGQLRRGLHAYLKEHPLVEKYSPAPDNQGGAGATIVELKD